MPRLPSWERIAYGPSVAPGESAMDAGRDYRLRTGDGGSGLLGVGSRLPKPQAIRLVEWGEELRERQAERARQPVEDVQRRRLLAALQTGHVGPARSRTVAQRQVYLH